MEGLRFPLQAPAGKRRSFMKFVNILFLALMALSFTAVARAQEGELTELDSVIARVNNDVILRSAYQRELQAVIEDLKQRGLKDSELEKKLNEIKPTLIDNLIDQQLLAQRAKEMSIDVESQINEQIVKMMKDNGIPTVEELEQKMREVGLDLNEQKRLMRYKFMSDAVLGREVYSEVYRRLTESSKKEYYEAHKEEFMVPGELELRRIFFNRAKNPLLQQQVAAKVKDIHESLKNGADFKEVVRTKSEDPADVTRKEGYIGWVSMANVAAEVREAVEKLPVGGITPPVQVSNGLAIYKVEGRKEPVLKSYDDEQVKNYVGNKMVMEKSQTQMETYLAGLRADAFIEIDARYRLPGLKTVSVNVKRSQYLDESDKERKKRLKLEKKNQNAKPEAGKDAKETKDTKDSKDTSAGKTSSQK